MWDLILVHQPEAAAGDSSPGGSPGILGLPSLPPTCSSEVPRADAHPGLSSPSPTLCLADDHWHPFPGPGEFCFSPSLHCQHDIPSTSAG